MFWNKAAEKLESREKLIAIPQEADLIMEERFVEDSVSGRDDRSNEDEEKDVRAVEERMLAMNLDAHEIQAEQSDEGWEVKLGDSSCGHFNGIDV